MGSACSGDIVAGKYRVERMLGRGGMGYVVAARHIELDQLVAIKFLTKDVLDDDAEAHARFRREARCTVRLTSEHIAKVHDVGVHDTDESFIVMDYLDGVDLGAFARQRGAISVTEACDYVLQACEALGEAHSIGVVHRDVKLANLFLTKSAAGRPLLKVLDFGISKSILETTALEVTRTQMMLGSPSYMSPEQMNDARSVDARTDLWSLGVVLYRLVSGRAPFEGDTIGRVCTMVLTEDPPPLATVQPFLPTGFDAIVARCLRKDRELRFANVAELATALAPFASDPEAAADRAAHIAAVLGVSCVSLLPVAMDPRPSIPSSPSALSSISLTLNPSWGPGTTGENLSAVLPPAPIPQRALSVATVVLAAIGVILFASGIAVFRVSAANAASVEQHLPLAAVPLPSPPQAQPPSAPAAVTATASSEPAALSKPPPRTPPRRSPPRATSKTTSASDGLPLPNDRR